MSLRSRLFLLLVALAALLAAGQYALIRTFSRDLRQELAETTAAVSRRVVQVFAFRSDESKPLSMQDLPEKPPVDGSGLPILRHDVEVIARHEPGDSGTTARQVRIVTEIGADGKPAIRVLTDGEPPSPDLPEEVGRWLETTHDSHSSESHELTLSPIVHIPTEGMDAVVERLASRFLAGTLALLAIGLTLAAAVAHRVTAPLGALVSAAERLGRGDLGTRVATRASGEVGRALVAFNAMSDRLRELDADARALRAREHLSELGEVGRGFAHSLRNPLNALGMAVDELAATASSGAPSASVGKAQDLSQRARRQIRRIDEALRAFLALGTDEGRAATVPVDLVAVARDVALELAQARPEGKETVRVEVVAEGPVRVDGVEAELRAALQALLVNAVEASPQGGQVSVRLDSSEDDRANLEVDDQGPGLPAEIRQRLFTPHVTTKPTGAGMGLYLAHRIATTRYGGGLTLTDRPEGGTRARLVLHSRAAETQRVSQDG